MKTFWLVCTFAGSGSYSFKIKLSSLPTQVVITLLSPSPKCNKCVRYFESSNSQFENWDMNPSANLLIANSLGIFKSPLSNKILKDSVSPLTCSFLKFWFTGVK